MTVHIVLTMGNNSNNYFIFYIFLREKIKYFSRNMVL